MNIISLVCANARVQGIYIKEQYKRALTSLKRKTRETRRGPGRMKLWMICGDPRYRCATLIGKGEIHTLLAP